MREQIKETNYLHPRLCYWLVQECPVSLNLEKRKKGKMKKKNVGEIKIVQECE